MAFHVRSTSFPSRSNPLSQNLEDELRRLRASEATTSSSSICQKLEGLKGLVECVNKWLQLPHTQQALSRKDGGKCVEEQVMDGYLKLLDLCSTTRDAFSVMKSCVQDLESSLRRRNYGDESSISNRIEKYIHSKKMVNKMARKCLSDLKSSQRSKIALGEDGDLMAAVGLLRAVEATTLTVFESLLSYLCPRSKSGNWSLVSKFVKSKWVSCEEDEEEDMNEVERVEVPLTNLNKQKACNVSQVMDTQNGLESIVNH